VRVEKPAGRQDLKDKPGDSSQEIMVVPAPRSHLDSANFLVATSSPPPNVN